MSRSFVARTGVGEVRVHYAPVACSCKGKPTDNGFIETFSQTFWAACLNQHWSMMIADAVEKLETCFNNLIRSEHPSATVNLNEAKKSEIQ